MRLAIIDLGTNSVRFDVHQLSFDKTGRARVRHLHREKRMVKLGQGVFTYGRLNPDAIQRTLNAFIEFEKTSRRLRVSRIIAFGTATLREAEDGAKLLNLIRRRTGIQLRVLSGADELKLIALGILRNEKLPRGKFGLIDIGGGSTEISVCSGKEVLAGHSFPFGTARLQQVFLRSSPPRRAPRSRISPVVRLRRHLRKALHAKIRAEKWPRVEKFFGSSGTVRALIRLSHSGRRTRKLPQKMKLEELRKLIRTMSPLTTTELLALPGMEPRRVDMILAGAILLDECMTALGAKTILPTEYSLRDGLLEEQLSILQKERKKKKPATSR